MGQKVNPLGFRLGITQKHRSQWFIINRKYSQLTIEDYFLRKKIFYKFADAGITNIGIHRKLDQIKIEIQTARPASLVGRDGNRLGGLKINLEEDLKKFRKKNVSFYRFPYIESFEKPQIALHVTKLSNPDSEAVFIADFLVKQIEKRISFRRAIKQAIQRAQRGRIKGIKIQISGRLNGAEIARSEWVREGRVPLQTLNANIDYSFSTAKTIYGIIGVKIWIFKGEKEL